MSGVREKVKIVKFLTGETVDDKLDLLAEWKDSQPACVVKKIGTSPLSLKHPGSLLPESFEQYMFMPRVLEMCLHLLVGSLKPTYHKISNIFVNIFLHKL